MTRTYIRVKCKTEGCENTITITHNYSGYCTKHRKKLRYKKKKDVRHRASEIIIEENYAKIEVLCFEKVVDYALIDMDDISKVKGIHWGFTNQYIYNNKVGFIHRIIMGLPKRKTGPDGDIVDHINGNTLDNRKINLRICKDIDNVQNIHKPIRAKSGVRGVKWAEYIGKWEARINVYGKNVSLGCHDSIQEAAEARRKGEEKYFSHKGGNPGVVKGTIKGVTFKRGKWEAHIISNSKYMYLGRYSNYEDAKEARIEAEKLYRKTYNRYAVRMRPDKNEESD